MTRPLSVGIDRLFTSEPTAAARVHSAARAGVQSVELWGWRHHDLNALSAELRFHNITVTSIGVDSPAVLGNRDDADTFVRDVLAGARAALCVGAEFLVAVSGPRSVGISESDQRANVVDALRRSSDALENVELTLLLEPLNRVNDPGWLIATPAEGAEIVSQVGRNDVRLLFDAYHCAMSGHDPADVFLQVASHVGHVHVADAPGAVQPGAGSIDWDRFVRALNSSGYTGTVGAEYHPLIDSELAVAALQRFAETDDSPAGRT